MAIKVKLCCECRGPLIRTMRRVWSTSGRSFQFLVKNGGLTRAQFERLADVPPEEEWLANITNAKTRRAYKNDVHEFITFTGLASYLELRSIVRSHIIGWRKDMESRGLAPTSIRRKLSALSSLFDYLCERNAFSGNPVDGVKRPFRTAMKEARRRLAKPRRGVS